MTEIEKLELQALLAKPAAAMTAADQARLAELKNKADALLAQFTRGAQWEQQAKALKQEVTDGLDLVGAKLVNTCDKVAVTAVLQSEDATGNYLWAKDLASNMQFVVAKAAAEKAKITIGSFFTQECRQLRKGVTYVYTDQAGKLVKRTPVRDELQGESFPQSITLEQVQMAAALAKASAEIAVSNALMRKANAEMVSL